MKKTAFQELFDIIQKANTIEEIKVKAVRLLGKDVEEIIDAFEAGNSYGQSILPTFDYPASRYYNYTYRKPEIEK